MRYRRTHFEQIPFAVVETVLRLAVAQSATMEESPAPVAALEPQAAAKSLKQRKGSPSKGQL